MNKAELKRLSGIRRREAKYLLDQKLFHGAYYLMGYSIECALKACICKQTSRHDFPDKDFALKVYTHNLESLVSLAGLKPALDTERNANAAFDLNWTIVKDWSEATRYELLIGWTDADDLYFACTSRPNVSVAPGAS